MLCHYCQLEICDGEKVQRLLWTERNYEIEVQITSHRVCYERYQLDRAVERAREQETGQNEGGNDE